MTWKRTDRSKSERFQGYAARVGLLTCYVEYFDAKGTRWHASVYAFNAYSGLVWQSPGYVYAKRETAERACLRAARRVLGRAVEALEALERGTP